MAEDLKITDIEILDIPKGWTNKEIIIEDNCMFLVYQYPDESEVKLKAQ